jgi:hypothetical protein
MIGPRGEPLVTHEQMLERQAIAIRTNLFMSLIPVVASRRLEPADPILGNHSDQATRDIAEKIAYEAEVITLAAMRKMGITFS